MRVRRRARSTAAERRGRRYAHRAGAKRRLALRGWYQLFDADAEGRLLVGNSWTLGFNWEYGGATGDIPVVHLVDGRALIAAIDAHGTP